MVKEDILTLGEVSQYLRSSRDTIYRMANRGDIPCFKVGRNWRFKKERIDQWASQQERRVVTKKREAVTSGVENG